MLLVLVSVVFACVVCVCSIVISFDITNIIGVDAVVIVMDICSVGVDIHVIICIVIVCIIMIRIVAVYVVDAIRTNIITIIICDFAIVVDIA